MKELFNTTIYEPIYNLLIFLMGNFAWIDLGLAVVIVTIFVKLLLFPFAKQAVKTQEAMKLAKPELDAINVKFKKNKNPTPEQRQAMGKETLEIYKKYGAKPFSSLLTLFIQLPIFLALYWIFYNGGLPAIKTELLYPFVQAPEAVKLTFLGFVDISGKSIILALIAGALQYVYMHFSLGKIDMSKDGKKYGALGQDFGKTMQAQMKVGLPILYVFISYISSVLALYFIATALWTIIQDWIIKKPAREAALEAQG